MPTIYKNLLRWSRLLHIIRTLNTIFILWQIDIKHDLWITCFPRYSEPGRALTFLCIPEPPGWYWELPPRLFVLMPKEQGPFNAFLSQIRDDNKSYRKFDEGRNKDSKRTCKNEGDIFPTGWWARYRIESTCNTGATVCGKRMDIRKWYGATDGRCKQNGLKCLND